MKTITTLFLCLLSLSLFGATATRIINLPERSSLNANDFLMVDRDAAGVGKVRLSALGSNVVLTTGAVTVKTNIAQLIAFTGATNGQLVTVTGYTEDNDGWGGNFIYRDGSTETNLPNQVATGGAWELLNWDGDVRAFGAKGNGIADSAAAFNAAIAYASASRIDRVYVPPGDYTISTSIIVRPNVLLYGDWTSFTETGSRVTNSIVYKAGASAWISLRDGANCPMVVITTNGATYLRNATSFYDGGARNGYYVNAGIRDIGLHGNEQNQTRNDCHAIVVSDAWNVTLERVTVQRVRGQALLARNLNAFRVHGCNFVAPESGRNVLLDDCADATLSDNYFFGGDGPIIWLNGTGGWKNQFVGNLIGNSYAETVKNTSFSGTNITVTAHGYETGDIVMFQSTGTMPTGISSNQTCMVIKRDANTFGVSTNWVDNEAGIALSLSGGTGTLQVYRGRPVGIFLSHGASRNAFTGNRIDQTFNECVYLQGTTYCSFVGNEISEAGTYGSPSATTNLVAAITLANGAGRNTIVGNVGTGADYALNIEDGCANNFYGYNSILPTVTELLASGTARAANGSFSSFGSATIGSTNVQTALDLIGGSGGQRHLKMTRPGVATNSIGVSAGTVNFAEESVSGGKFFIFSAEATDTTSAIYIGGNSQANRTNGIPSTIRASTANTALTNPNLEGGDLILQAGLGTGTGVVSQIDFQVPANEGATATSPQPLRTVLSLVKPTVIDTNNANTGLIIPFWQTTNGIPTSARLVATNEGGIWRLILIP